MLRALNYSCMWKTSEKLFFEADHWEIVGKVYSLGA